MFLCTNITMLFTDQFIGPGKVIGPLCVCVLSGLTIELNDL